MSRMKMLEAEAEDVADTLHNLDRIQQCGGIGNLDLQLKFCMTRPTTAELTQQWHQPGCPSWKCRFSEAQLLQVVVPLTVACLYECRNVH